MERAILAALHKGRQPLLPDRWHPLLVQAEDERELFTHYDVGDFFIVWMADLMSDLRSYQQDVLEPLSDGFFEDDGLWDEIVEGITERLDEILHAEPHVGEPLTYISRMMHSADDPHTVEVSVQRAAKRLEAKSLIQRRYVTRLCWTEVAPNERTRTFVCVRIPPTREELRDSAELRAQARRTQLHHLHDGMRWIRERGESTCEGDPDGYMQAAIDWAKTEAPQQADWKWLEWFGKL